MEFNWSQLMKDVGFDEYSLDMCSTQPQNAVDLKNLGAKNNFGPKTIFTLNIFKFWGELL